MHGRTKQFRWGDRICLWGWGPPTDDIHVVLRPVAHADNHLELGVICRHGLREAAARSPFRKIGTELNPRAFRHPTALRQSRAMIAVVVAFLAAVRDLIRRRADLEAELLALRHQVLVLQRHGRRARLRAGDRLAGLWSRWREALIAVRPETVIAWHRLGFRLFWRWKSRRRGRGRPAVPREVIDLIQTMQMANLDVVRTPDSRGIAQTRHRSGAVYGVEILAALETATFPGLAHVRAQSPWRNDRDRLRSSP